MNADEHIACFAVVLQAFSSSRHRKVALYVALRGDMTDADGHGTHTSGTLAGGLNEEGGRWYK